MAGKALLGRQIRRFRRDRDLSQVELARRLGISASYLNLIEHNQRPLTPTLQVKLGEAFEVDLQTFSRDEEARLLSELRELFGDPLFREADLADQELREMVDAAPAACRAMLSLYRAYCGAREDVRALSERLSSESFLSTSPHELRTLLTSIRSFSEILLDYQDMESDKRQQFVGLLVNETQRLSMIVNQMLEFATDDGPSSAAASLPRDEVSDFLQARGNHFPELEAAADSLRKSLVPEGQVPSLERLAEALSDQHGIVLKIVSGPVGQGRLRHFDVEAQKLLLSEALPEASRRFLAAQQLGLAGLEPLFDSLIDQERVTDRLSRALARRVLAGYFAGALLLPYGPFLKAAKALRYDIDRLAARFGASFEQTCQRLSSLGRPGAQGVPFHFLRIDIAGNLSKRFSASGLQIPRFGGLCPRRVVHLAFLSPGRLQVQQTSMPDGRRYLEVARALVKPTAAHGQPASHISVGLGCEISFAGELVYADGLDLESGAAAVPVGGTCRLCERVGCGQRAHPPILSRLREQA